MLHDPKQQRRLFSQGELKELFTLREAFHGDEEAPNDTALAALEGVVTKGSVLAARRRGKEGRREKKRRGKEQRRRGERDDEGEDEEEEEEEEGDGLAGVRVEPLPAALAGAEGGQGGPLNGGGGEGEEEGGEAADVGSRPEDVARQQEDDNRVLAAVFGGKGLAGVLSHDAVERGRTQDADSWMRVQDQARRIADVRAVLCCSVCPGLGTQGCCELTDHLSPSLLSFPPSTHTHTHTARGGRPPRVLCRRAGRPRRQPLRPHLDGPRGLGGQRPALRPRGGGGGGGSSSGSSGGREWWR